MSTWTIVLQRIDNQVIVLQNGSSVFDSGVVPGNPPLNQPVTLNLPAGENTVEVWLYNTPGGGSNPWEVAYTITDPNSIEIARIDASMPGNDNPVVDPTAPVYKGIYRING
jgi:hypothetical protein